MSKLFELENSKTSVKKHVLWESDVPICPSNLQNLMQIVLTRGLLDCGGSAEAQLY